MMDLVRDAFAEAAVKLEELLCSNAPLQQLSNGILGEVFPAKDALSREGMPHNGGLAAMLQLLMPKPLPKPQLSNPPASTATVVNGARDLDELEGVCPLPIGVGLLVHLTKERHLSTSDNNEECPADCPQPCPICMLDDIVEGFFLILIWSNINTGSVHQHA